MVFEFKKLPIILELKNIGACFSNVYNTDKHFLIIQHN